MSTGMTISCSFYAAERIAAMSWFWKAHQVGLTDVRVPRPLDDLLLVVACLHPGHPRGSATRQHRDRPQVLPGRGPTPSVGELGPVGRGRGVLVLRPVLSPA
jgi:hypothetical protein